MQVIHPLQQAAHAGLTVLRAFGNDLLSPQRINLPTCIAFPHFTLSHRKRRTVDTCLIVLKGHQQALGASWQAVSSSYNDEQNQQPMGGYALLGLRAHWQANSDVRLDVKVDNLLDKTFTRALYGYDGNYYGYREERRSLQVAVTWTPSL